MNTSDFLYTITCIWTETSIRCLLVTEHYIFVIGHFFYPLFKSKISQKGKGKCGKTLIRGRDLLLFIKVFICLLIVYFDLKVFSVSSKIYLHPGVEA